MINFFKKASKLVVFGNALPAFDDGRATVEDCLGRNLLGPEKLRLIASISADVWNTEVSVLLNTQGALSQKDFEKVKSSP